MKYHVYKPAEMPVDERFVTFLEERGIWEKEFPNDATALKHRETDPSIEQIDRVDEDGSPAQIWPTKKE